MLSGCTIHPLGESAERQLAADQGVPFKQEFDKRTQLSLSPHPRIVETIDYAFLTNAELEARYWQWRAAIEEVPQAGTQAGNVALFGGTSINKGKFSLDRTTASLGNDPMADIVLPFKLSHAAKRALEKAKAAGNRFDDEKFALRAKVISAYYDYLLNKYIIKFEKRNHSFLETGVLVSEARNRAGNTGQDELLKLNNELSLSKNEIASLSAKDLSLRAQLNALLSRPPDAELDIDETFPKFQALTHSDPEILQMAQDRNYVLLALSHEIQGEKESNSLARLQQLPDFSLSAGTDLKGIAQNIMGMMTIPFFRFEAIQGAIHQAEAALRATEAMRRQTENELNARVVLDLTTVRDLDRQIALFNDEILPRSRQIVTLSLQSYKVGKASLLEYLENQRSELALERLTVTLEASRAKSLADLEAAVGGVLTL